jgi:hypothetical protein
MSSANGIESSHGDTRHVVMLRRPAIAPVLGVGCEIPGIFEGAARIGTTWLPMSVPIVGQASRKSFWISHSSRCNRLRQAETAQRRLREPQDLALQEAALAQVEATLPPLL